MVQFTFGATPTMPLPFLAAAIAAFSPAEVVPAWLRTRETGCAVANWAAISSVASVLGPSARMISTGPSNSCSKIRTCWQLQLDGKTLQRSAIRHVSGSVLFAVETSMTDSAFTTRG